MKKTAFIIEKVSTIDTRRDIFWSAVAILGVCMCLYIYFVTATVRNVVMKRQLSQEASTIDQTLSSKQFALINLKNNLTLSYAKSLGFTDAQQKVFITPTSVSVIAPSKNTL